VSSQVAVDPIAACARLRDRPGRVLLHSGRDDDGLGRWSFVASDPVATLIGRGDRLIERDAEGRVVRDERGDPFAVLERFAARHGVDLHGAAADAPDPRVIGWLGYELGRRIEPSIARGRPLEPSRERGRRIEPSIERARPIEPSIVAPTRDADDDVPDLWMAAYGAVARWRAGDPAGEIVGADAAARDRLAGLLADAARSRPGAPPRFGGELRADPDDVDGALHRERVAHVLRYIAAGDVYQVNLARRLTAPVAPGGDGDALALYVALDRAAPAPYAGLVEAGPVRVLSGSPECFHSRRSGDARIVTRPIKGTRPRPGDPIGDRRAAAALAADPKDAAEHVMIVDLERNDLGRVAITGSVRVDRLGYVVELPHLYHKVSEVSAELRPEIGLAALLRATFPGGSITGAPKVRAMQIIDELEPVRRGPYCGAIGYLGAGGAIELAIAIRIAVLAGGELRLHVGGGIVADSDPARELAETDDKAAGWRRALASLPSP